jgi:hypothetical protein
MALKIETAYSCNLIFSSIAGTICVSIIFTGTGKDKPHRFSKPVRFYSNLHLSGSMV